MKVIYYKDSVCVPKGKVHYHIDAKGIVFIEQVLTLEFIILLEQCERKLFSKLLGISRQ